MDGETELLRSTSCLHEGYQQLKDAGFGAHRLSNKLRGGVVEQVQH
jgi:hypothetical protein